LFFFFQAFHATPRDDAAFHCHFHIVDAATLRARLRLRLFSPDAFDIDANIATLRLMPMPIRYYAEPIRHMLSATDTCCRLPLRRLAYAITRFDFD